MYRCMQEHGMCHIGYCANGPFNHPILVMSICSAVLDLLILVSNVLYKFISFKGATIGQIGQGNNAIVESKFFKILLGMDSFYSWETKLKFNMYKSTSVVQEDTSPNVLVRCSFAKGVKDSSF